MDVFNDLGANDPPLSTVSCVYRSRFSSLTIVSSTRPPFPSIFPSRLDGLLRNGHWAPKGNTPNVYIIKSYCYWHGITRAKTRKPYGWLALRTIQIRETFPRIQSWPLSIWCSLNDTYYISWIAFWEKRPSLDITGKSSDVFYVPAYLYGRDMSIYRIAYYLAWIRK